MGTIKNFEELEIWISARELVNLIYSDFKDCSDFAFRNQITRAGISIMNNIAEGFYRNSDAEFRQFLNISKGSAGEVRAQLYVALDQNYVDQQSFNRLHALTTEISRMIGGLMNYLQNSGVKGTKYKKPTKVSTRNPKPETRNWKSND